MPANPPRPELPNVARPRIANPRSQRIFQPRPVSDVHGRRTDVPLAAPVPALVELASWLTPAFYVDFGRPCDAACLYCSVPPHEDGMGFLPFDEVPSIVAAGKAAGCDRAILIGGEPTIYPQLFETLDVLRDAGLPRDHIVMTNGRRLAEPGFVDRLVAGGAGTLHVSFDSTDPAVYDALSRTPGGHGKLRAGLRAALAHGGAHVYLYVVVTRPNAAGLGDIVRFVASEAEVLGLPRPPTVVLAVAKPVGDALRHADLLLVAPMEAARLVRETIAIGQALGVPIAHRNVQACLAPDLCHASIDYYLDDFSVDIATLARVTYSHHEYWMKRPSCATCGHEAICTGIYRDMAARFGDEVYVPIGREGLTERA